MKYERGGKEPQPDEGVRTREYESCAGCLL